MTDTTTTQNKIKLMQCTPPHDFVLQNESVYICSKCKGAITLREYSLYNRGKLDESYERTKLI